MVCLPYLGNFNERPVFDENAEKRKIQLNQMKEESNALDKELEKLEKDYLAKITQLLLMAEAHCEIKKEINEFFVDINFQERDATIQSEFKKIE